MGSRRSGCIGSVIVPPIECMKGETVSPDEYRVAKLEDDQIFHVYPTFGREHVKTKMFTACWCDPRVEFVSGSTGKTIGAVIIHEAEQ